MPNYVDFAISCPQTVFIFGILTECVVLSVIYRLGVAPILTTVSPTPPFTPSSSIQGLAHISLRVEDVKEAAKYYERILGFQSREEVRTGMEEVIWYLGLGREAERRQGEEDTLGRTLMHPSGLSIDLIRRYKSDATAENECGLDNVGVALRVQDCGQALLYLRNMASEDYQLIETIPDNLIDVMDKPDDFSADLEDEKVKKADLSLNKSIKWLDSYGIKWEFKE